MARLVTLTPYPVRYLASAGVVWQPLWSMHDVSDVDILDLALYAAFELPSGSPSLTVSIYTAGEDDGQWSQAAIFPAVTQSGSSSFVSITAGLLRFVRYQIASLTSASAAGIFIRGCGRKRAA